MSKCLQATRKQERFWEKYESHWLRAHRQEQSRSARFTGGRPPFYAMLPKWHHLKISGRTSSFCSHYFIGQKLVNAVYNTQNISASDTKQASCWPCICLSQVAELNLPVSAAIRNHRYSWFLSDSSESDRTHWTGTQGTPDQGGACWNTKLPALFFFQLFNTSTGVFCVALGPSVAHAEFAPTPSPHSSDVPIQSLLV